MVVPRRNIFMAKCFEDPSQPDYLGAPTPPKLQPTCEPEFHPLRPKLKPNRRFTNFNNASTVSKKSSLKLLSAQKLVPNVPTKIFLKPNWCPSQT